MKAMRLVLLALCAGCGASDPIHERPRGDQAPRPIAMVTPATGGPFRADGSGSYVWHDGGWRQVEQ